MWTRHRKPSKLRHVYWPCFALCVMGYFVYHAFHGSYGLKAKEGYVAKTAVLETQLATLDEEVRVLEHRTSLLRDGSLEQDMLDEQARAMLGWSKETELVINLQY